MDANERVLKAVEQADAAALRSALADGGDPNTRVGGFPVLHMAAINGEPELVEALLKGGADANLIDEQAARTALMYLAFLNITTGQTEALQRLLAGGANPNLRHKYTGETALDVAAGWTNERSGRLLVESGAVATRASARRWAEHLVQQRGTGRG